MQHFIMLLFLSLNIDLYFVIPLVFTQTFNLTAELVIPIGILTKEAKAEIETHPVIVEITISEWSIKFKNSTNVFMLLTH